MENRNELRQLWNQGDLIGYCFRPETLKRKFSQNYNRDTFNIQALQPQFWNGLEMEAQCTSDNFFGKGLPIGACFIRFSKSKPGQISASYYCGNGQWSTELGNGNALWGLTALQAESLFMVN